MSDIFKKYMEDISLCVNKYNEDYEYETEKRIRNSKFQLEHTLAMIEKALDTEEEQYREYILENAREHNLDIDEEIRVHFGPDTIARRRNRSLRDICYYHVDFETLIIDLMDSVLRRDKLYFDFGKYKGRIVQDVYEKDRNYCKWFLDNIQGRTARTLQVLDFLSKKERKRVYTLTDPITLFNKIIKDYNLEKYGEWIDTDEILSNFINDDIQISENSGNSSYCNDNTSEVRSGVRGNFFTGENSAFWNSMIDVEDIVDYEDLC